MCQQYLLREALLFSVFGINRPKPYLRQSAVSSVLQLSALRYSTMVTSESTNTY
jgi:hypothetical protein